MSGTVFFRLGFADDEALPAAATLVTPEDPAAVEHPLMGARVEGWEPPLFSVSSPLTDYLANHVAARLCSARLREVIESQLDAEDDVQWLPARVRVDGRGAVDYHVLHVVARPDVWDPERTIRAGTDFIVKPVVQLARVGRRRLLAPPKDVTRLIVDGAVRRAVEASGCTGIEFSDVPTTH